MYSGVYAALLTPFTTSGQVNPQAIKFLIDFLLENKINGLYLCGGTGESILLTENERKLVTEIAVNHTAGRVPIIVHVGAPSTAEAEHLAAHAIEVGANAVASVPPFYYNVGLDGIEIYYKKLAAAAKNPVFFYNIPASTQYNLGPDLATSLFKQGIIQGIKYTSNDMLNLRAIMDSCGKDLTIFSGPDEMLLPFLTMGVNGGIGATYNCMPKMFVDLYRDYRTGNIDEAQNLQYKIDRFINIFAKYGVIAATKAVMQFIGLDCGAVREPLVNLNDPQKAALKSEIIRAGFFD